MSAVILRDSFAPLSILFLFLMMFFAMLITQFVVSFKKSAPTIAGSPVKIAKVKYKDVINSLPISVDALFAAFAALSKLSLFFVSFLHNGSILSNKVSKLLIPKVATFDNSADKINFHIAPFSADISSLIFFALFAADVNVFSFFCKDLATVNKEFLPTNKSPNFLMTSFFIMRLILRLTFDNALITSGAALISLMITLRSFSFIFKSFSAFLNTFDISFTFCFPKIMSFREISLRFRKASIIADIPPPFFSFSMLLTIASATF